jgi:hypothetical protein
MVRVSCPRRAAEDEVRWGIPMVPARFPPITPSHNFNAVCPPHGWPHRSPNHTDNGYPRRRSEHEVMAALAQICCPLSLFLSWLDDRPERSSGLFMREGPEPRQHKNRSGLLAPGRRPVRSACEPAWQRGPTRRWHRCSGQGGRCQQLARFAGASRCDFRGVEHPRRKARRRRGWLTTPDRWVPRLERAVAARDAYRLTGRPPPPPVGAAGYSVGPSGGGKSWAKSKVKAHFG